jgi:hypothetical protein
MEHPRTESARAHDDHELIEGMERAPGFQGGAGGTLARDIATQAEQEAIADPDGHHRVTKVNAMKNGQAAPNSRVPDL